MERWPATCHPTRRCAARADVLAARFAGMDGKLTIYHDGSCPLCRAEIAQYRRDDVADRLIFVDVSDPAADAGPDLDRTAAMARFHVREPDGRLLSGAAAFAAVWQRLPRWRRPAQVARLPGALALLEVGYRVSQPLRPRIARLMGAFEGR